MYLWRKMDEMQKADALEYRMFRKFPKHSPPHFDSERELQYILTSACYEHSSIIGNSFKRMCDCETAILEICEKFSATIYAWCILPNHYHLLLKTSQIGELRKELGLFHGRSSFQWNKEDNARGRQVWHNCFERKIKSERHFYASLNYVLNNAVHHGYVKHWEDWEWSNAKDYLENIGREKALKIWREYPILNYGDKWDKF